jgi:hypothetical protein
MNMFVESEVKFDSPSCSFLDQPNHAKVLLMIPKGLGERLAMAKVLQRKSCGWLFLRNRICDLVWF